MRGEARGPNSCTRSCAVVQPPALASAFLDRFPNSLHGGLAQHAGGLGKRLCRGEAQNDITETLVRAFPGPEAIVSFSSQRDRSSHGFCRHMRIHATNLPRAWQD